MSQRSLRAQFYIALASSFIVIGLHLVATTFYLYWTFPRIDIFMHIAGGVMAGLYGGVFLKAFKLPESFGNFLLFAFIVGFGWEILELFYKVADVDAWYWVNTVQDLIDDMIGGALAYYLWRKI